MIPYTLHTALILACCISFYKVFLQNETFYQLNRFLLLGCLVLSFTLPMLPIPEQWSFRRPNSSAVIDVKYELSYADMPTGRQSIDQSNNNKPPEGFTIDIGKAISLFILLYWFGVFVFTINFLLQVATLLSRIYFNPVIKDGRFTIVELSGNKAPCSFANIIFINPEKYDWETYNQILEHEKIHIRQRHSVDIFLAEIMLIFQWFNPFAWLYRKELEKNLEFFTDDQMMQSASVDGTSYQLNLLKVSAPHYPLNLTTNYNQSLLKKRVIMMNTKKSSINAAWKYIFLLPLLIISVAFLNKPIASSRALTDTNKPGSKALPTKAFAMETEGSWFATIKNDQVIIQFKNDDNEGNAVNGSSFSLKEFEDLPRETTGIFSLNREAGALAFTGMFEGNQGMGRYEFTANKKYTDFLHRSGINAIEDQELLPFFLVDVKGSYIEMLRSNGYTSLSKNDLIRLVALKIDAEYIRSLKVAGYQNITIHELISLRSLGVNSAYITDIRKAGYKNVSVRQLITFKAQGINGRYIADILSTSKGKNKFAPTEKQQHNEKPLGEIKDEKAANFTENQPYPDKGDTKLSSSVIVNVGTLRIGDDYIRSLDEVGYKNLSTADLIQMKAQGINARYISNLQSLGYKNISTNNLLGVKALNISGDYIKSFETVGFVNIPLHDLIPFKALHITAEYIRSFQLIGYRDISAANVVSLKAHGITPTIIQEYKSLGFENAALSEIINAKATGTSVSFITSMKEKGHHLKSIKKYIELRNKVE